MAGAKAAPQGDPDSEQLRGLKLTCMANLLSTAEERVYFKDLESRFLFVSAGWLAAYARAARRRIWPARRTSMSSATSAMPPFTADPARIGQLIGSLITNAVKFTAPGGRVEVRIGETDGQALVTVSDTGAGIPAADLERIFERFYRTAAATKQAIPGTGLGWPSPKPSWRRTAAASRWTAPKSSAAHSRSLLPLRPVPATAGVPAQAPRPGH